MGTRKEWELGKKILFAIHKEMQYAPLLGAELHEKSSVVKTNVWWKGTSPCPDQTSLMKTAQQEVWDSVE